MYKKELKILDSLFEYNGVTNIMPGRDYSQHLLWMNEYLADIDNLLADADLQTIDHHNFTDEIEYSNNFLIALLDYAKDLQCFVLSLLDTPFKDNLTDNAVDKINDIDINSYSTDNTLDIKQRGFYNRGTKDFNYTSIGSVRFQDFIVGNAAYVVPDEFKGFTTQFSNYYENVKTNLNGLSEEEFLYGLLNKDTPEMELKKFVSAVLDITIIKPLIETFTGEDLITGQELSSMERGIKFAGAVVGIITLGSSGILKMPLDQAAQQLGRTLLIDAAATSASYATGIVCEELDLPVGLTVILCIAVGTAVSITLNGIEFRQVGKVSENTNIRIEEVVPPGSNKPVAVYTDGNAQINVGKVDVYMRGKVQLDVDATTQRINELNAIKRANPSNFTDAMKEELKQCNNRLHNYQRSIEMANTLDGAGITNTLENNNMIVESLFDAAKEVKASNTEIISYIEGTNGQVQVVSRWKILPDGKPYLATVILKPVK